VSGKFSIGCPHYNQPQPCTEEEVRALEEKLGQSLPAAYREFLLWMGHGAKGGSWMVANLIPTVKRKS